VDRDAQQRHGGDRQLDQARADAPAVGGVGRPDAREAAEQVAFAAGRRGAVVVGAGERADPGGQGAGVVAVAALGEQFQQVAGDAVAGAAEAGRPRRARGDDGRLGAGEFGFEPVAGVAVQPGFVAVGVVADLVPGGGDVGDGPRTVVALGVALVVSGVLLLGFADRFATKPAEVAG
jgi:hypothetical protein